MSEQELAGKVAVVTGAAQGIGKEIAVTLARSGARVAVVDRDADGAERTASELASIGAEALAVVADVTSPDDVERAFAQVDDRLGVPDVLVNNAGILRAGPLVSSSLDDWDAQFQVNTRAAYLCVRSAAQRMLEAERPGAIVVVTSNCARTPRVELGAYCASKAASDMMARCFAMELAPAGIRVNSLCPGSCDTELQRAQWTRLGIGPEQQIDGNPQKFRAGIPMGRLTRPEDVARMALVLVTDRSSFVTGQSIHVDGAQTLP